jgi:hypothetical protein
MKKFKTKQSSFGVIEYSVTLGTKRLSSKIAKAHHDKTREVESQNKTGVTDYFIRSRIFGLCSPGLQYAQPSADSRPLLPTNFTG